MVVMKTPKIETSSQSSRLVHVDCYLPRLAVGSRFWLRSILSVISLFLRKHQHQQVFIHFGTPTRKSEFVPTICLSSPLWLRCNRTKAMNVKEIGGLAWIRTTHSI